MSLAPHAPPVPPAPLRQALIAPRFAADRGRPAMPIAPRQAELLSAFRRELAAGAYRLAPLGCPCGAEPSDVVVAQVERYGLPLRTVLCETCGALRFDPYFDEPSLARFYRAAYQDLYARSADIPAYCARQAIYGAKVRRAASEQLPAAPAVFEIGCGAGGALAAFAPEACRRAGCEFDERLVAHARSTGLDVLAGDLPAVAHELQGARFDLIFSHHVLEHVAQPEPLLRCAAELLAPGGWMLHVLPDILGIGRSEFPAGDALQYLHVAHAYNYTLPCLQRLARRVGLRAERITPPPLATPWSHAAEMWIAFRPAESAAEAASDEPRSHGAEVQRQLAATERLYRLGLCPGQFRRRLQTARRLGQAARAAAARLLGTVAGGKRSAVP